MGKFGGQVDAFSKKFALRYRAVAQEAVQQTVALAQRPGPTANNPAGGVPGGRMPIVTGFLRASVQVSLTGLPAGPTMNDPPLTYTGDAQVAGEPVSVTLLRWRPENGETIYVGWTAAYARFMEAYYGFMRGATEVWDETVAKAVRRVRRGGV